MNNFKNKFENTQEKLAGEAKEAVGKITGNEQLELKGKIQSSKADFRKDTNIKNKIEEIKENVAGKINDKLDDRKKKSERS